MTPKLTTPSLAVADAPRFLTALPVFDEAPHVTGVLNEVVKYASDVLVVDDGSTDGTRELLSRRDDVNIVLHDKNRGYGAALQTVFEYAIIHHYDLVVTIDCDGQHEPQRIVSLVETWQATSAAIVSGSRYLNRSQSFDQAPTDRRRINEQITAELNQQLGLNLTDAFCGFKAYCTRSLAQLELTETGYALPLELWVQAAHHQLKIVEMAVPLIYLDQERTFGGALDAADTRLAHYRNVIHRAVQKCGKRPYMPASLRAARADIQPCS